MLISKTAADKIRRRFMWLSFLIIQITMILFVLMHDAPFVKAAVYCAEISADV